MSPFCAGSHSGTLECLGLPLSIGMPVCNQNQMQRTVQVSDIGILTLDVEQRELELLRRHGILHIQLVQDGDDWAHNA